MSDQEFERVQTRIYQNSQIASVEIARQIAQLISEKNIQNQKIILGLATGSSPLAVYKELVRLHKQEGLSFRNVVTFNLDEYFPIDKNHQESYFRFMHENLFNHIDIPLENVHIPKGNLNINEVQLFCQDYDAQIEEYGGIDIQILGIGRTGHIGFNEPGSTESSKTRLVTLDPITKMDAASSFGGFDKVPKKAITMGVKTIMKAKKIILMAWGVKKASIVNKMVEGPVTEQIPSTFLQKHDNVQVFLDQSAGSELTRFTTPWLVRECDWRDQQLVNKAVLWLSKKKKLPILKLKEQHYNEHGLNDLIQFKGSAYDLNIEIFNQIQKTITGWPGGKPGVDDTDRVVKSKPVQKKVIVFAPRPNDELVGMGGTLMRLVQQNHDVYVVYQTSGSFGVHDSDARKYVNFARSYNKNFFNQEKDEVFEQIINFLDKKKKEGDADNEQVRQIKSMIRQEEASLSCRKIGIKEENIIFLKMPFYETGKKQKNAISSDDIKKIKDVMNQIKPDMIFANGELSDPNGTTRTCLNAFFSALAQSEDKSWISNCYIWLYRAVWNDWQIFETDMHVPMTEEQIENKRRAIFCHQSQKDNVMYKGEDDNREFWEKSEQRNINKATELQQVGLASYYAIEVFSRYHWSDKNAHNKKYSFLNNI